MSDLLAEVGLRLAKALVAGVFGLVLFGIFVGPLGNAATTELALLSWIAAAGFILLVETSPI